jgi:hypothetical protein
MTGTFLPYSRQETAEHFAAKREKQKLAAEHARQNHPNLVDVLLKGKPFVTPLMLQRQAFADRLATAPALEEAEFVKSEILRKAKFARDEIRRKLAAKEFSWEAFEAFSVAVSSTTPMLRYAWWHDYQSQSLERDAKQSKQKIMLFLFLAMLEAYSEDNKLASCQLFYQKTDGLYRVPSNLLSQMRMAVAGYSFGVDIAKAAPLLHWRDETGQAFECTGDAIKEQEFEVKKHFFREGGSLAQVVKTGYGWGLSPQPSATLEDEKKQASIYDPREPFDKENTDPDYIESANTYFGRGGGGGIKN